jgi:hypothetical protein
MTERIETMQAAYFYVSDLKEELDVTDVNRLTKKELVAQVGAWTNSIGVAQSLMEEALKDL